MTKISELKHSSHSQIDTTQTSPNSILRKISAEMKPLYLLYYQVLKCGDVKNINYSCVSFLELSFVVFSLIYDTPQFFFSNFLTLLILVSFFCCVQSYDSSEVMYFGLLIIYSQLLKLIELTVL